MQQTLGFSRSDGCKCERRGVDRSVVLRSMVLCLAIASITACATWLRTVHTLPYGTQSEHSRPGPNRLLPALGTPAASPPPHSRLSFCMHARTHPSTPHQLRLQHKVSQISKRVAFTASHLISDSHKTQPASSVCDSSNNGITATATAMSLCEQQWNCACRRARKRRAAARAAAVCFRCVPVPLRWHACCLATTRQKGS